MPETKEIIVQETPLIPAEVVENATTQSKFLMDIVNKTKCYQEIKGKKYLQVEAWETIGAFNSVHAETKQMTPILRKNGDSDEVIGYEAHVQLIRNGNVVGGAIMPCYFTENACRGKQGDDIHKACMSAAQTFATSKAYRMNFSYVAILAGYQPMPAEEITEDFKEKPKAKGPAPKRPPVIDMDKIRDGLIELQWADCPKWLKEHYGEAFGTTVRSMIESLTPEHQQEFAAEVQKRLQEQSK